MVVPPYFPNLSIVCAIGKNGEMGKKGDLVWRHPEDLAHFKAVTKGKILLMGSRTFQSLPCKLPGRIHWVVSQCQGLFKVVPTTKNQAEPDLLFHPVSSLPLLLQMLRHHEVCLIGGAYTLRHYEHLAGELILTRFDAADDTADAFWKPTWELWRHTPYRNTRLAFGTTLDVSGDAPREVHYPAGSISCYERQEE